MAAPQDGDSAAELEPLTFEQAFQKLQETVAALEQGGLPLEQVTSLYEEGMSLVRQCNGLLDGAELKITQLQDSPPVSDGAPPWPDEIPEWLDDAPYPEEELEL
jgi:exodeoxyribonuclease VII small subunit